MYFKKVEIVKRVSYFVARGGEKSERPHGLAVGSLVDRAQTQVERQHQPIDPKRQPVVVKQTNQY